MVQAKHKKAKPKKPPHVKKHGKQADITEFRSHLDALGLKIVEITSDGNCFFRALADQLEGNEEEHQKYRLMVVQYIQKHKEEFEPFIEDEVPFDEYCQSMETDGTWAGNMELQAGSLVTHTNICIHRMMSPRWYIRNFDDCGARMIHLSYHNDEHYNSVRSKEDPCSGPAKPIVIKADADLSATSRKAKAPATKREGLLTDTGSVKLVMIGSGCEDANKVDQVLQELYGDVDAAIEFLIAEARASEDSFENNEHPKEDTHGHVEDGGCEWPEMHHKNTCKDNGLANNETKSSKEDKSSLPGGKKVPPNKICPCGSKKKYKACCGSVTGKSTTEFVINHKVGFRKAGKQRRQSKRGEVVKVASSDGYSGHPPDMGALCI